MMAANIYISFVSNMMCLLILVYHIVSILQVVLLYHIMIIVILNFGSIHICLRRASHDLVQIVVNLR